MKLKRNLHNQKRKRQYLINPHPKPTASPCPKIQIKKTNKPKANQAQKVAAVTQAIPVQAQVALRPRQNWRLIIREVYMCWQKIKSEKNK